MFLVFIISGFTCYNSWRSHPCSSGHRKIDCMLETATNGPKLAGFLLAICRRCGKDCRDSGYWRIDWPRDAGRTKATDPATGLQTGPNVQSCPADQRSLSQAGLRISGGHFSELPWQIVQIQSAEIRSVLLGPGLPALRPCCLTRKRNRSSKRFAPDGHSGKRKYFIYANTTYIGLASGKDAA